MIRIINDMISFYDSIGYGMELICKSGNAYYSILFKPSFEAPNEVIFFLLDEVEFKLYIVDINY
jgi:hypothetical protein